jgi:hypothetical protein
VPELPKPLPPGERTVGQVIAESIRAYGNDFWRMLPLGFPLALADQLNVHQTSAVQIAVLWGTTPLFVAAYIWACRRILDARPTQVAIGVAVLIWLPFPALRAVFLLPGVAWLAFIGLAVPAAMVEKLGFRDALSRGRQLGTADYAHALGSLAALVVVVGVAANTLSALLHTQSDNGARAALFISDLVLSPLLFIGGALLYVDQLARIGTRRPEPRSRDADLHPSLEPDAAGGADAQVEP